MTVCPSAGVASRRLAANNPVCGYVIEGKTKQHTSWKEIFTRKPEQLVHFVDSWRVTTNRTVCDKHSNRVMSKLIYQHILKPDLALMGSPILVTWAITEKNILHLRQYDWLAHKHVYKTWHWYEGLTNGIPTGWNLSCGWGVFRGRSFADDPAWKLCIVNLFLSFCGLLSRHIYLFIINFIMLYTKMFHLYVRGPY